ncbi:uncharacterized protein JCM10292_007320 [Rhodotorula paludigena]|uniref:uncharacterized protein n=1 Tax=Rhodotorula paludigena TaxID=86838 RepID=UPI0031727C31
MLKSTANTLATRVAPRRVLARTLASAPPHPLANRVTPRGPVPASNKPAGRARPPQKWSTLTAILLATLTGSLTYAIGRAEGSGAQQSGDAYREPTQAGFEKALAEIREWLPEDELDTDRETLVAHGYNSWAAHGPTGLPGAVLYPRSTEDVVKIVKTAAKHSIPLIPYCAGTSLEGHTTALGYPNNPSEKSAQDKLAKDGHIAVDDLVPGLALVLDFAQNMNNIISLNSKDLDAVVQPGVSYDALNAELKEQGIPLFFPVDPAPGAQIGGMIGTGASGTNAVRYGTMRDNVLNLTVVLPNGEVIKTRQRAKKSSVGPDLSRLFIGAEGTLGIVTEATLKLAPLLPSNVAVSSFPSIAAAAAAARDLVQSGISLACVELLDDVMVAATNAQAGSGRKWPVKPSLFLKFSGTPEQMKLDIERTKEITQSNEGSGFAFARNEREAEEIWHSRKIALWSALEMLPGAKCWVTDVCVPLSRFPELITETQADIKSEGIVGPIVSHAGDGNFHALLLFRTDDELKKVERLVHNMVERAQRMDGTATGEHGVGIGKKPYVENELGSGTVELLRQVKRMIDPQNIMNPGKLIPDEKSGSSAHAH